MTKPWDRVTALPVGSDAALTAYTAKHSEVMALKALASGNASEEQQKRALQAIFRISHIPEDGFDPSGERETAFKAGKRFVGLALHQLIFSPLVLKENENDGRSSNGSRSNATGARTGRSNAK